MTKTQLFSYYVNRIMFRAAGGATRPQFYEIDTAYPSLRLIDGGFAEIRSELVGLLKNREAIPRYHEVSKKETFISGTIDQDKSWRVFLLSYAGVDLSENRKCCPRTAELIDKVPGVVSAFFSILDPGKSIPAHDGPYLGYLRYHLGLIVPRVRPPSIRVHQRVYTWAEGESILFDDSWNHEVFNSSEEERVVLIVDVRRPMAFPFNALNWFIIRILARFAPETEEIRAKLRTRA